MSDSTYVKQRKADSVMGYRLNCKKLALFGVFFILIVAVYHFWFNRGSRFLQISSAGKADDGIDSFTSVRFEDTSALVPYEGFTRELRFSLDQRPEYSIAVKLLELEKENVDAVISLALRNGQPVTGGAISERHFQYGISRHLPGIGEEYTLVFRTGTDVFSARVYKKLTEPLVTVTRHDRLRDLPVHIVMPLAGRLDRLRKFLDMLAGIIDEGDNVQLTVVAFPAGGNGTEPAAALLRGWRHSARTQLISETGPFSRGRALNRGAAAALPLAPTDPADAPADPLLFFCDVDMTFSAVELERCRVHAERGRAVYYPIVFSQFNPRLRAALRQSARWPPEPAVSVDTGSWRHYGFGMSCQYRSDFMAVSGAFMDVHGWGGEDVALYKRFLQRLRVVRAFDEDLIHDFHAKECSEKLSAEQYRSCVFSKIANEGSKLQLGLLALSNDGQLGPRAYVLFYLPWFQRPGGWVTLGVTILLALSLALNVLLYRRLRSR